MCGEYFDEVAPVDLGFWDRLADSLHRTAGDLLEQQPALFTERVLGVGNHIRAAAAAALPGLSQIMREAAEHEQAATGYRRRAIALGIDPELAERALEEAIVASQESPRPFRIADAEDRLRRLVGPADVPPDFVQRLGQPGPWRIWSYPNSDLVEYCQQAREAMPTPPPIFRQETTHEHSYTMDGVEQQIVEDAHRAYAAHLERRERDLRAAYGIPDEATTEEAIRIIRQHGNAPPRGPRDLHAPGRAMDITVPWFSPDEARQLEVRAAFRRDGESRLDAIDRVLARDIDDGYRYSVNDQAAFDTKPDHCWRCCAVKAQNDLGTCNPCREDLRS